MWRYVRTDELVHYGVKGMKWGVRKDRNTSSAGLAKLPPKYSEAQSKQIVDNLQAYYKKNKGLNEAEGRDFVVGKNPDIKSASRHLDNLMSEKNRLQEESSKVWKKVLSDERGSETISKEGIAKMHAADARASKARKALQRETERIANNFLGKHKDDLITTTLQDDNEEFVLARAKQFVADSLYVQSWRRVTNHPDADD